jgi:predicted aspartyl protease
MGETIVKIKVSSLTNKKLAEVEVLADTGTTYTTLPAETLEELGVKRSRKIDLELANGSIIQRDMSNVLLEVEGIQTANPVIFAEKNDAFILGLVTLESCGLMVDTINRKLVPLPKIHHYIFRRILCKNSV